MTNKIWTIYGFFENYEAAKNKLNQIKDEYDLCKIKKIREKTEKGRYKLKVWTKPIEKNNKKNKRLKKVSTKKGK